MNWVHLIWGVVALLLMAAEFLISEVFLFWIGLGALMVFFLLFLVPLGPLGQVIAFCVFTAVSVWTYVKVIRPRARNRHPERLVNQGPASLVGSRAKILEEVRGGVGKAQHADAIWNVVVLDDRVIPAGTLVRFVEFTGKAFLVEEIQA